MPGLEAVGFAFLQEVDDAGVAGADVGCLGLEAVLFPYGADPGGIFLDAVLSGVPDEGAEPAA